jgi:hypothetical protein
MNKQQLKKIIEVYKQMNHAQRSIIKQILYVTDNDLNKIGLAILELEELENKNA